MFNDKQEVFAKSINTSNGNKWRAVFSNIPYYDNKFDVIGKKPMAIFDNYVRNVILPDMSIEYVESNFGPRRRLYPSNHQNTQLNSVSVEFACDENMFNYYSLYSYWKNLKNNTYMKGEDTLHNSVIGSLDILFFDNEQRVTSKFRLTELFMENLSSLSLVYGSSDELIFTVTFFYDDLEFILDEN